MRNGIERSLPYDDRGPCLRFDIDSKLTQMENDPGMYLNCEFQCETTLAETKRSQLVKEHMALKVLRV